MSKYEPGGGRFPEVLGYELWEAAPGAKLEDHYKVAVFDDIDYAESAAAAFRRTPEIPGHNYYVMPLFKTNEKTTKAFKRLNIGGSATTEEG